MTSPSRKHIGLYEPRAHFKVNIIQKMRLGSFKLLNRIHKRFNISTYYYINSRTRHRIQKKSKNKPTHCIKWRYSVHDVTASQQPVHESCHVYYTPWFEQCCYVVLKPVQIPSPDAMRLMSKVVHK